MRAVPTPVELRRSRAGRGSTVAAAISLVAVTGTLFYAGVRLSEETPGLAAACRGYAETYRAVTADSPDVDAAPQVTKLNQGAALSDTEVEDLRDRVEEARDMYTGMNDALEDVVRAAESSLNARNRTADEADMFLSRVNDHETKYLADVATVLDAETTDQLVVALNEFGLHRGGPGLAEYPALYAAVASESSCADLLAVSQGVALTPATPTTPTVPAG